MAKAAEKNDAPPPKKSKKMLFIIIGVVLVILIGGGGFFVMKKMGGKTKGESTASEEGSSKKEKVKEVPEKKTLDMDVFVVNLQDNSGTRYLKLALQLEMNQEVMDEATEKMAKIRDSIIILLSGKRYSDVGSIEGKYQLRDEIASRINQILTKGTVEAIYFTDFVIQ